MDKRSQKVVFIMGTGHCGSTLLDLIIGSHQECFSLGQFMSLPLFLDQRDTFRYLQICGVCGKGCAFWNEQITLEEYEHHFFPQELSYSKLFTHNVYEYLFKMTESYVLIDSSKNPMWIQHQIELLSMWPDILPYLIFLCRDGRAIVNANLYKYPDISVSDLASRWKEGIVGMDEYFNSFSTKRRVKIHYEDLSENPDDVIASVCQWLDFSYESDMLSYWKHDHHPIDGNLAARSLIFNYQNQLSEPIFQTLKNRLNKPDSYWNFYRQIGLSITPDMRWKHHMSPEMLQEFDSIAGDVNTSFGYQDFDSLEI